MLENIREPQERNYTTEREMLRQAGALPQVLTLPDGQYALGWWDAKEYVESRGFSVEIDALWRVCQESTPGAVQREINGVLQWTDGFFPKGMLVEGVVVAPVFGRAWAQWVYPVPLLDEAMERVSTNGGL